MKEIINLNLIATEEGNSRNPKAVMDSLLMLQFNHRVSFDQQRMLVLCDVSDSTASQKTWEAAGRRFPLAFFYNPESAGGRAVKQLYSSLSDRDLEDVDLIPANVGCRMSLYVKKERTDLISKFWLAMFPPNESLDSVRGRGGRSRMTERITAKVPEDLALAAITKVDILDRVIHPDGTIYVTAEALRRLQRECERELLRKQRDLGDEPDHSYRGGR